MHDTYAKFGFQIQIQIMCHASNDKNIYILSVYKKLMLNSCWFASEILCEAEEIVEITRLIITAFDKSSKFELISSCDPLLFLLF